MYRKEINILRKIVHQVGFIYKIIYRDARSTKHKILCKRLSGPLDLGRFGEELNILPPVGVRTPDHLARNDYPLHCSSVT